jgi:hypothetical protein
VRWLGLDDYSPGLDVSTRLGQSNAFDAASLTDANYSFERLL